MAHDLSHAFDRASQRRPSLLVGRWWWRWENLLQTSTGLLIRFAVAVTMDDRRRDNFRFPSTAIFIALNLDDNVEGSRNVHARQNGVDKQPESAVAVVARACAARTKHHGWDIQGQCREQIRNKRTAENVRAQLARGAAQLTAFFARPDDTIQATLAELAYGLTHDSRHGERIE